MTPRAALEQLVAKLDEIEACPEFKGIWPYLTVHGMGYTGPNYAKELAAARAALAVHAP